MGDVIHFDESRVQPATGDVLAGQIVDVRFDNDAKIVFVEGVPWAYDMLLEMTRARRDNPGIFMETRLDERGRVCRAVLNAEGKLVRFTRDVGLDGEVEHMPGAPVTEPLSDVPV